MKTLLLFTSLIAAGSLHAATAQPPDLPETSRGRYITGGIVGSTVGFGIGHGIQQRYRKSHAWIYSASEAMTLTYVGVANFFDSAEGNPDRAVQDQASDRSAARSRLGGLVLLAIKAWETVDVWTGAKIGQDLDLAVTPAIVGKDAPGVILTGNF